MSKKLFEMRPCDIGYCLLLKVIKQHGKKDQTRRLESWKKGLDV
jgi:hypothetical protein